MLHFLYFDFTNYNELHEREEEELKRRKVDFTQKSIGGSTLFFRLNLSRKGL